MAVVIAAAVEGLVDEAVACRLIRHAGAEPGTVYGRSGKSHLRQRIAGYGHAARHAPWFVLVDLDHEAACAAALRGAWLASAPPGLCLRVAVRAVEAWLLADDAALAEFLSVARSKVAADPDRLPTPKQTLVDLARSARRRAIRDDIVPREGSGRTVGPAYTSRVVQFVSSSWRPEEAACRSESLRRAIVCLERLVRSCS